MAKIKETIKKIFGKDDKYKKEVEEVKEENLGVFFNLGDEKEKEVCDRIELMVEDAKASRAGFMTKRADCIKLYEGIREPKNKPWPDCSNISTMVTTVSSDLLQAKLFPMIWNPDTIYWEGTETHDVNVAEDIKTTMAYVVGTSEMKLEPDVDDILHKLVIEGTVIAKLAWRTYWTTVTRKVPKVSANAKLRGKLEYEIKYERIKRERCFLELKDLERVYLPYDAKSEEDAEFIIEEIWYTMDQLREMQAEGLIPEKINLDDLLASMDDLEEFEGTKKEQLNAEGTVPVNTRKEAFKIKCYEGCIKFDADGDKLREECVFLVAARPKKYLAGKPLHAVSRIGKRPWIIRPFLRRPGRIYGKSIPELVFWLHKELDAIHNQRIDAGNMAIAPFFFYRTAAGNTPTQIVVGPATGVPTDDPDRDVRFPQFPSYGLQVSFQEERIVMELIERLTFLTPAMMGKELAQRPTVRGTLAVMSQGEQKFGLLARRVQFIIGDLLTAIKQKYEENMSPDMQTRITGKEGKPTFEHLSPETIAGQYDCKMALDLTAGNVGMEREINTIVFQYMGMDPFVQQNPAYGWEVRADWLTSMNKKNVERLIGPKPEVDLDPLDADDIFAYLRQGTSPPHPKAVDARFLNRLLEIRRSEAYNELTPESKALYNRYLEEVKILYAEGMQERMAQYAERGGIPGAEESGGFTQGTVGAPGMGVGANKGSAGPVQPGGGGRVEVQGEGAGRANE